MAMVLVRSSGGIRNALCRATRERNQAVVRLLLKFNDGDTHGEQYVGVLSDALAEVSGKIDGRDIARLLIAYGTNVNKLPVRQPWHEWYGVEDTTRSTRTSAPGHTSTPASSWTLSASH